MIYRRVDGAVTVSQPHGLAEAFKRLAIQRTATVDPKSRRRRVWAQDLHEEAVRDLLDRLARGEKVVFVATPLRGKQRKTMWLDPALWTEVRKVAIDHNVSVGTVVLTACLAYLEAHGIELK